MIRAVGLLVAAATTAVTLCVRSEVHAEPRAIHEGMYPTEISSDAGVRQWAGPRPAYYGAGSECSPGEATEVAHAMWDVGANDAEIERMLGIISRESGCDSGAVNMNSRTKDASHGLCQQNSLASWFKQGQLLGHIDRWAFPNDFSLNAYSCALMWSRCSFGPWNYGNYYCRRPR